MGRIFIDKTPEVCYIEAVTYLNLVFIPAVAVPVVLILVEKAPFLGRFTASR